MHGWQKRQQGRECIGHIALPTPKHLVTACDAAVTGPRVGHGFAASTGQYGLLALTRLKGRDADSVEAAELRAAYWAFRNTNKAGERPVLLLADSKTAVRYIESWRKGGTDLPDGYPTERMGHASTLAKFAAFLNRNPSRLRVQWVKGHAGHELNEFADSLAKLALRNKSAAHVRPIIEKWAESRKNAMTAAGKNTP